MSHEAVILPKAWKSLVTNSRKSQYGLLGMTNMTGFDLFHWLFSWVIDWQLFWHEFQMLQNPSTLIEFDFCPDEWFQVWSNPSLSKVETVFVALIGSVRAELWLAGYQHSSGCVCDFLILSSGAPCLAGSCPKPFLWRWFSWKRRWPDSPQPPHSRTLRLSQHWALVGSEEWSL